MKEVNFQKFIPLNGNFSLRYELKLPITLVTTDPVFVWGVGFDRKDEDKILSLLEEFLLGKYNYHIQIGENRASTAVGNGHTDCSTTTVVSRWGEAKEVNNLASLWTPRETSNPSTFERIRWILQELLDGVFLPQSIS